MNLNPGDATQSANVLRPEPTPIFRVVPTRVPTPVPAPDPVDSVRWSQSVEIQLLQSQGEDRSEIDARLGLSVATPISEDGTPVSLAKD